MSPSLEVKVISALTGPKTLDEIANRVGERKVAILATLKDLQDEGTVRRGGKLFWLTRS